MTNSRLETSRIALREFVEDDWEAVHVYGSDPEVGRHMPWGPNSEQDTKDFIQQTLTYQEEDPRKQYELAVIHKDGGRLIGGCGLHLRREDDRCGWIGYCLNKDYWGLGIGTEAARLLLKLGFDQIGLHRIFATCDADNIASARVLEKAGMMLEGRLRDDLWMKGRWRDSLVYAILEDEWKNQ